MFGPLLFILYVNNVPDLVDFKIKMFADDIKIYTQVTSFSDALSFQNDLDKLCGSAIEWLLHFNFAKCKQLKYDTNTSPYIMNHDSGHEPPEIYENPLIERTITGLMGHIEKRT